MAGRCANCWVTTLSFNNEPEQMCFHRFMWINQYKHKSPVYIFGGNENRMIYNQFNKMKKARTNKSTNDIMKEKIKVFCCTCSVLMTLSCTNFQPLEGEYSRTNIHISQSDNRIEPDDFEIELFVPLTLPDGVVDIAGAPVFFDNKIYVCDSKRESVMVFDNKGNLLHRNGRAGHARNEIIGRIEKFDVDRHNGDVHIYNREGGKILIFDSDGVYKRNVRIRGNIPSSICLTSNGNYVASCDYRSSIAGNTKLVMWNADGKEIDRILEEEEVNHLTCEGANTLPLFSDRSGNITYLSLLSDSLVVLNSDTVKEVIKVEFEGGFLSDKVAAEAKKQGDTSILRGQPVMYISQAMVNDSFTLIEYYDGEKLCNHTWMKSWETGNVYYYTGSIFLPRVPGRIVSIDGNTLVGVVTQEKLDVMRRMLDMEMEQSPYNKTIGRDSVASKQYEPLSASLIVSQRQTPVVYKVKLK